MKALLQRVTRASVSVAGHTIGSIDSGLVVLLGVAKNDTEKDAQYLATRIIELRIFEDSSQKFNLSVKDLSGSVLIISQFTLLCDARKGRRPSFTEAALPDYAEKLFECFVSFMKKLGVRVETGQFRAHMVVEIMNDGPVTILLDSKDKFKEPSKIL